MAIFKKLFVCLFLFNLAVGSEEITPYKCTDEEFADGKLNYKIPESSRHTLLRKDNSEIVYYLSKPAQKDFPIVIITNGSSSEDWIISSIFLHRYYLKEFLDLGIGVVTIEKRGVDGDKIAKKEFIEHYTCSNILKDHRIVIEHIKKDPPNGWNGKLIFFGISEGGNIATTLTYEYQEICLVTVNWSGASGLPWNEELWDFWKYFEKNELPNLPWYIKLKTKLPSWFPFAIIPNPKSREDYDNTMKSIIQNPTSKLFYAGMTYKYHHDLLQVFPKTKYEAIKTPYLVVAGAKDSGIHSSDVFVKNAGKSGVPIFYFRISDMDHFVKNRPDVVKATFDWIEQQIIECYHITK